MDETRQGPLARFKVIDLTRARAGPTAARHFADFGADVIKVEVPTAGDDDALGGDRDGPDFFNLHRNKRSLSLNLKTAEGVAVLKKLAATADVLIENYRPDVKHRLGIDYETLRAINPRLVYVSLSGFGQDGPYANRPGFDQIAQGMGGLMSITGLPGQGPVRVGIPIADLSTGNYAAMGAFIALLEREISGEGQWVQTSLLQSQISMLDFQAARWTVARQVPGQAGNDHPTSIPTGVFPTADGHINIAASGQHIFRRLCEALDAPGFLAAAQRGAGRMHPALSQRRPGGAAQCGGRAVGADLLGRPGVRRPAGAARAHGGAHAPSQADRGGGGEPGRDFVAHASGDRPADAEAGPAQRGDPGRARLRRGGHRRSAHAQGDLAVSNPESLAPGRG
jgi:crotonobetainyl-CoA:carnitine CoA-transferase CaiB-like acyl-CoA transferase